MVHCECLEPSQVPLQCHLPLSPWLWHLWLVNPGHRFRISPSWGPAQVVLQRLPCCFFCAEVFGAGGCEGDGGFRALRR